MNKQPAKTFGLGAPLSGGLMKLLLEAPSVGTKRVCARGSEIFSAIVHECCVNQGLEFSRNACAEGADLFFIEVSEGLLKDLKSKDRERTWLTLEAMLKPTGTLVLLYSSVTNKQNELLNAMEFPFSAEFTRAKKFELDITPTTELSSIVSLLVERKYEARIFTIDRNLLAPRFFEQFAYQRPKAYVHNNYFSTAGGGERSTLDYAFALDRLGFEVSLVSTNPQDLTLAEIISPFFDGETPSWKVEVFDNDRALSRALAERHVEVFVNHSYGSFVENRARVGIYAVMFPHEVERRTLQKLDGYQRLCTISPFTQAHVALLWGRVHQTTVLVPPISDSHIRCGFGSLKEKQKKILVIGRFNVLSHNKNQLMAVQSFVEMKKNGSLDPEWELVLVGNVNSTPENIEYVDACREAATGFPVSIRTNVALEELLQLYRSATCLWQFTGYGLSFGESPQRCEHLGLVAMDCFVHGVIPLVYERSGAALLIDEGITGWAFNSKEDLASQMQLIEQEWQRDSHAEMVRQLNSHAELFDTQAFTAGLKRILVEEWR